MHVSSVYHFTLSCFTFIYSHHRLLEKFLERPSQVSAPWGHLCLQDYVMYYCFSFFLDSFFVCLFLWLLLLTLIFCYILFYSVPELKLLFIETNMRYWNFIFIVQTYMSVYRYIIHNYYIYLIYIFYMYMYICIYIKSFCLPTSKTSPFSKVR